MSHHKIDYVELMRSNGLRVTSQRLLILDAICEGHGHTTLGQIYARVRKKDASIDRSTVYRTLDIFVELGLVVSADTGIGEKVYEIAKLNPHHHLVCKKCGQEREIDNAESGAAPLVIQRQAPENLVTPVAAHLQPQFADKDVTMTVDLPLDLPAVRADADRIEQVLTNLLGNALQYTPEGGAVTISARATGDWWSLWCATRGWAWSQAISRAFSSVSIGSISRVRGLAAAAASA